MSKLKSSAIFQMLYEIASGKRKALLPKGRGLSYKIFRFLMSRVDKEKYFIKTRVGRSEMLMPLYHELAWKINYNKLYSRNLGRINSYISKFNSDYGIVDVGANIGDSAFLLRETDQQHFILSIEGNSEYLPLLRHNAASLKNVTVAETFVGNEEGLVQGELISDGKGTTLIKEGGGGAKIKYTPLGEIIKQYVENKVSIKLLKIDTDGYDCPIIKGNIEFIVKNTPVLFFEYAPSCFLHGQNEHFDIFKILQQNGYCFFIFYDGAGNYLISSGEKELDRISKEMQFYFSSGYKSYGDIVVFHKSDEDLFNYTVSAEKDFYKDFFARK